ncbi:MFS transporter [Gordonia sp. SID5947]|uniref:MFS transporter n=1 Tax=Gordonia sp. SID5947 TaxID=2690315 RepID=UPI00136BE25F|nr:MFS transporter [Gordonia sp. SID5947]MYR06423.1 MFS transporter [Gordonia sp. SID5947]
MASNRSRRPLTLALCGGYFLVLLDVTVVNVALPQIGDELHAGSTGPAWTVDAYSVPLAALLLASGAIGDRIGHRRVVLLGMVGFGAASALCALAPTIGALVAARAVQGIGAALMLPGTLALLVDTSPDETSRNRLVGTWAAVGGAALPAGPVVGGLLVQAAGWRAVFWPSVPVIAAALVPVIRLRRTDPRSKRKQSVKWIGAALLVTTLTCVVTAIIQAPSSLIPTVILTAMAVCALLAFRLAERRATHPLLPVPRPARGMLGLASLAAGLMNLCALGGLFLLTQVFQDVDRLNPLVAGLLTLPAMLPLPLLGAPAGRLATRIGVWPASAIGAVIAGAGMTGIAATLMSTGNGYIALILYLTLWGAGLGVLTPAIVAAALKVTPETPGLASGAGNTARQTGGALGIAIVAAIAGSAESMGFAPRSAGLFVTAGAVFVLVGVLCSGVALSDRHRRTS